MRRNILKRIFPSLLMLCMFFAMLPATVYAAEPDQAPDISVSETDPANENAPVENDGSLQPDETNDESTPLENDAPAGDLQEDGPDAEQDETPGDADSEPDGGGSDPIHGSVRILKTDEANAPLSGAVFGIYNASTGEKIAEITTGSDGTAVFEPLDEGGYYLKELAAPAGFVPLNDTIPFSIAEQSEVVYKTIANSPARGTLKAVVSGSDGQPVSGAALAVYREADDAKITEISTGSGGTAEAALPLGSYYLVQTQSVQGYLPAEGRFPFTLAEHGQTAELAIQNQKEAVAVTTGAARVVKRDKDTGALLSGAVFGVYETSTGAKAAEITTGSDGTATTGQLPAGSYYLLETAAPSGYKLNANTVSVQVTAGQTAEATVYNEAEASANAPATGSLRLIKTDADTGERLSGAVFGVYRASDDEKVGEVTTGSGGAATLELTAGSYYLRELTAPAGYVLSKSETAFTIQAGETSRVTVTNAPEESGNAGTLRLVKTDKATGDRLSGAVFGIYTTADDKKIDEITTGNNGAATVELAAGNYYLMELAAPKGYVLSAEKTGFVIKDGETKEITVTNEPEQSNTTGLLRLFKTDKDSGKRLSGAVFGVYSADDKKVAEITTDSNGTASYALPADSYYLLELTAPDGYALSTDKTVFRIQSGQTTEVTVANAPTASGETADAGALFLTKKAEATGKLLSGAVFGVYDAATGVKVAEITTGSDGTASCELTAGNYYLRELKAPMGYALETAKIPFTVRAGNTVKVEVTNMLESSKVLSTGTSTGTDASASVGAIAIPKTGEAFPVMNYVLSALCLGAAALCGGMLRRNRKQTKRKR